MTKIKSVTIGIPAYNEEVNIGFLLRDLLDQKIEGFNLSKIVILSDGSTDETVNKARSFNNPKIQVVERKERLGKSASQNEIISKVHSDILVLLDADILISDKYFLSKLISPIIDGKSDMTSSGIKELPTKGFFDEILNVSMKLKTILFNGFKNGNNVYNCHGPARAFSKEVFSKITFTRSEGEDMYSYLFCISQNKRFSYVKSALVEYQLPATPIDHYKQSKRYLDAIDYCTSIFGQDMMRNEFNIGLKLYLISTLKGLPFIISHLHFIVCYVIVLFSVKLAKILRIELKDSWNVSSSKTLHI